MDELPGAGMGRPASRENTGGRPRSRRRPNRQPEPGVALDEAVRSDGPLGVDQTQALGSTLASLLMRLHTAGSAHGDIRPATVFLTSRGAHLGEGDPFRQAAIVSDSVHFVAPELLDDPGAVSPATDVFALGAVLAFAATGHSPLEARPETQPQAQLGDDAARPDLSAVPEPLRRVVERCLDTNPAARPTVIALSILFAARLEELPAPTLPAPLVRPADEHDSHDEHDEHDELAYLDKQGGQDERGGQDEQGDAGDRAPEPGLLLQKPLFFFVRGPRNGRTAAAISGLALTAAILAVVSAGLLGSDPHPAPTAARGAATGVTGASSVPTPTSGTSSAPALAPVNSSSAPAPAPVVPKTTSKAPPPPAVRPSTSPAAPLALAGAGRSTPGAPGSPRVVSGYVMTVNVSWGAAPGATSYEVSYSGSVSGGGTVTTSDTSTTLKGLFPSEQLCAKVRSVNQYGASSWVSASSCIMVI